MRPFLYERAPTAAAAVRAAFEGGIGIPTLAEAQFIAGGTTMLDLMKLDTMRPQKLIDLLDLSSRYAFIRHDASGLQLGALTRMQAVADDPHVNALYPVIAQSLQLAASAQLRYMATLGGNVLQRTRCNYFRNADWPACNKRVPGSGCSALDGVSRKHAVLGVSASCISAYPGDFAQALVALGATIELLGPAGRRSLPFESLHLGAEQPERETVLRPGDLITSFTVPAGAWTQRSLYLKVRDRESYEFALASAAVALQLEGDRVITARIALGGVAYRPWRAHEAEAALAGRSVDGRWCERYYRRRPWSSGDGGQATASAARSSHSPHRRTRKGDGCRPLWLRFRPGLDGLGLPQDQCHREGSHR
jgi:xanthine dehydrogenase YagS FAD-binding subunit